MGTVSFQDSLCVYQLTINRGATSVLVNLLKTSEDALVLAVAAHDLGQYVKYAEGGKR